MAKDAVRGGDLPLLLDVPHHFIELHQVLDLVDGGVDADDLVTNAERKAVIDLGADGVDIVGGMVGLKTCTHTTRETHGADVVNNARHLVSADDQIQTGAQLGDGCCHFAGQTMADCLDILGRRVLVQDPGAHFADGLVLDLVIGDGIDAIIDSTGDFIILVRNNGLGAQDPHRDVSQNGLGRYTLCYTLGSNPCSFIARLLFVRLCKDLFDVLELVRNAEQLRTKCHVSSLSHREDKRLHRK